MKLKLYTYIIKNNFRACSIKNVCNIVFTIVFYNCIIIVCNLSMFSQIVDLSVKFVKTLYIFRNKMLKSVKIFNSCFTLLRGELFKHNIIYFSSKLRFPFLCLGST